MLSVFGLTLIRSQSMKHLADEKKSRLITKFASILIICMGALLLYVWLNYDNLRSEQAYRQMWYLNHKFDSN